MKESEIKEIIERRKVLVETATSDAQKEIYQGYLEHWEGMIKKPKKVKCSICGKEYSPQGIVAHEIKCRANEVKLEIRKAEELRLKKLEEEAEIERLEREKKQARLEKELEELKKEGIVPEFDAELEKEPKSTENNNI